MHIQPDQVASWLKNTDIIIFPHFPPRVMKKIANMLRVTTIIFFVAQASVVSAGPGDIRNKRYYNPQNIKHNPIKHNPIKNNPSGAPIDGGVSLLLAGGAAYVLRRISKARRKVA